MPVVSVVVATQNRKQSLLLCLAALECQTVNDFEIIISDGGSTDGSVEAALEWCEGRSSVKHAWMPYEGFRLAKTRNNGLRLAQGDAVVFIDSDTLLNPEAVRAYADLYRGNPSRAIAGYYKYLPPMLITPDDVCTRWNAIWEAQLPLVPGVSADDWNPDYFTGRDPREAHNQGWLFDDEERVHPCPFSLCGGNLMIPRAILDEVGWWDESFTEHGGEDAEMSLRIAMRHGFSYSKSVAGAHVAHPRDYVPDASYDLAGKIRQFHPRWFTKEGGPAWTQPGWEPYPGRAYPPECDRGSGPGGGGAYGATGATVV